MSRSGILIYCERTNAWATALRRETGIGALAQRETRSLDECEETLGEFPASLVVLEITAANLEKALRWLSFMPRDFPQARAIVVAERGLESHEWIAREFGCLAFTASPRELAPLARLAVKYIDSLPVHPATWEDQIWSHLPWGK